MVAAAVPAEPGLPQQRITYMPSMPLPSLSTPAEPVRRLLVRQMCVKLPQQSPAQGLLLNLSPDFHRCMLGWQGWGDGHAFLETSTGMELCADLAQHCAHHGHAECIPCMQQAIPLGQYVSTRGRKPLEKEALNRVQAP